MSSPNQKPEKGFLKELSRSPKPKDKKEEFTWKKPISTDGKAEGMKTSYRLSHFSSAKEGTSNLCQEHSKHVENRRAKK